MLSLPAASSARPAKPNRVDGSSQSTGGAALRNAITDPQVLVTHVREDLTRHRDK